MGAKHGTTVFFLLLATIAWGAMSPFAKAQLPEFNPESVLKTNPNMEVISSTSPDTDYGSRFVNSAGRFDRNADGRVDLIVMDRNNDRSADYWATDRNYDGMIDDFQYDRNFNGQIDQWEYDYDGDGIPDKIYVDANGDGRAEMYSEWNPVNRTYIWYGKPGMRMQGIRPSRRLASGKFAYSE